MQFMQTFRCAKNTVLFLSSGSTSTCQYPQTRFSVLNHCEPDKVSSVSLICGRGMHFSNLWHWYSASPQRIVSSHSCGLGLPVMPMAYQMAVIHPFPHTLPQLLSFFLEEVWELVNLLLDWWGLSNVNPIRNSPCSSKVNRI